MKRVLLAVGMGIGMMITSVSTDAAEIGFIEDFALAKDRAEALKQLIPGTEEYYYYHCLHHQSLEQYDKVAELLKVWVQRHNVTPRAREVMHRQALLTYNRDPKAALEYLRQQLNLQFSHQRERLDQKQDLPVALDQELLKRERLRQEALRRHGNLNGFEDGSLDWLITTDLNPELRRQLLQRLQRPDHANLARLVVEDLDTPGSGGFGSLPIHQLLLLRQLDECLRLKSDLVQQTNFIAVYLSKLWPGHDVDWRHDPKEHEAYLDRLWEFVNRLPPAHQSLKAHVLYQRLALDRSRGVFDKDRFMTYVRLPRNVVYVNPDYLKRAENRNVVADLNQDFSGITLCATIGNDEPLVRDYLQHFFVTETTYKPYEPYINDLYLKHQFAETKIVNGLGEPEQWYSLLPPDVYQQLKERIDIDFSPTNRRLFAANEPVSLDVHVKNVKTILVKVYEINTKNYHRQMRRDVNTDINLDGLVANAETTYEYTEPSIRRVSRHFDFPQLKKPGVYVIDFIGNGRSSRVLVRKGDLRFIVRNSIAGHVCTVLDENNDLVKDATLWIDGHEYRPNADGLVVVPYSHQPSQQAVVLSRGDFSAIQYFGHQGEYHELRAGIYVDRESLLSRKKCQVMIRPGLYLNGTPVSLADLEETRLVITSLDHDGTPTTLDVPNFKLYEDRESTHEFHVPSRMSQITFTLAAKIRNRSQNKKTDLSVSETFTASGIEKTEKIEDLHFSRVPGGYFVELLGKTGEVKADRAVQFAIKHRDFRDPIQVTLQTDDNGRVGLGPLPEIAWVTATGPEGTSHTWPILDDQHTYLGNVHARAGDPIDLPYMGSDAAPNRAEFSLLELRGQTFVEDRFAALKIERGNLRIAELPRGDYDLLFKRTGMRFRVRVTEGPSRANYAMGTNRLLEVRGSKALQLDPIQVGEKELTLKLRNASKFSRVHVFATRYQPVYPSFAYLARVSDSEPYVLGLPKRETMYLEGRDIGDEYRYVLDRRFQPRLAGNMLERPSLLLNPWAIRNTETQRQEAKKGDAFAPSEMPKAAAAARPESATGGIAAQGEFANLDFLLDASTVLVNLRPNEAGQIVIPREELGSHHFIHVVAVDPLNTAYRVVALDEQERKPHDLRLVLGLDPAKHFTQQKQITVVAAGDTFELPDVSSSRFEAYDTLARVHTLFSALSGDTKLAEFSFVLQWTTYSDEKKRELYSKYACHELSFFLAKKDPEFFTNVIQSYLRHKKDKTFVDRWLIGDDLRSYLAPWNFDRLNIVERILLAERIEGEGPNTARHVRDLFDLIPPNAEQFNRLFGAAVRGRELDPSSVTMLAAEVTELKRVDELHVLGDREELARNGVDGRAPGAAGGLLGGGGFGGQALGRQGGAEKAGESKDKAFAYKAELEARKRLSLRRGTAGSGSAPEEARFDDNAGMDAFFDSDAGLGAVRQLFQQLDKTQEWVENNYYQLPIELQSANLITANAFWNDYAARDPEKPFFSRHLPEAARNFPEMMLALAVLDLPFQASEHETTFEQVRMRQKAGSPLVMFHEEIREAKPIEGQTSILVSQNFFRQSDRYRHENNQQYDKFVTDEFLAGAVYGCQVVVTNPTSAPQKLDVLLQVPVGAIPVMNGQFTRGAHLDLAPFNTQTVEYYFYFPRPGRFPHYPVHVARNDELLASAKPFEFLVVDKLSKVDAESWDYISQFGTEAQVIEYLTSKNLARVNLEKIAWRVQNEAFFDQAVSLLTRRHAYNHALWSYAVKHNRAGAIREFLQHADDFVATCGDTLDSPLLVIDPVARGTYEHRDYKPLVNARAHPLGKRRQILNGRFHEQYHHLLKVLGYRRQLTDDDRMAVVYYLLLQDRIPEAGQFFAQVNADRLATRLQYDYFTAYLAFGTGDFDLAREIADKYADYPVDRWRTAFASIDNQLQELAGRETRLVDTDDRNQRQAELAASEPSFDFQVETKKVRLDYQHLSAVQVNYYLMDIELMFSTTPFVDKHGDGLAYIRPNSTQVIELPSDKAVHEFSLPEALLNRNVLIEIIGAGQVKTQAYYSNSLAVQLVENYGQVRVQHEETRDPLAKVYVKVYARLRDGTVRFYKDGYTDPRGRFDYASLNTNELDFVDRFAILILSDDHGATVREASRPKQ